MGKAIGRKPLNEEEGVNLFSHAKNKFHFEDGNDMGKHLPVDMGFKNKPGK